MDKIDLDAARAARIEVAGEGPVVVFGGEDFRLPAEIPASVLEGVAAATEGDPGGIRRTVFALLGDEQAERFFANDPSIQDLTALIDAAVAATNLGSPGEQSASDASS